MTLFYKARQSAVESDDGIQKWFPKLVKSKNVVTTNKLASEMAKRSSLTPGDVKNVLENLPDIMSTFLLNGDTVKIDGLGCFTASISASGAGVDTEEEVNAGQIKLLRILFTPSYTRSKVNGVTRAMFEGVTFRKYEPPVKSPKSETNNGSGNGGDYVDPNA